jgi:hypothetical protein
MLQLSLWHFSAEIAGDPIENDGPYSAVVVRIVALYNESEIAYITSDNLVAHAGYLIRLA